MKDFYPITTLATRNKERIFLPSKVNYVNRDFWEECFLETWGDEENFENSKPQVNFRTLKYLENLKYENIQ